MSRLSQVIQMGEIREDFHIYIEDYAYTYLKKQKGKDITKYFLYGEIEKEDSAEKIYVYGIGEKPKLEQSYFKEYYPIGYLKIKQEKAYWISLKGKEEEITGCYLFYASNQAMQEYLVDHRQQETSEENNIQKKKRTVENELPMKEVWVSSRRAKSRRVENEFRNEKFILPIGGILLAVVTLMVLLSPNGRKKAEIMKEVIARNVSEIGVSVEDEFSIEEKAITPVSDDTEEAVLTDSVWEVEEKEDKQEEESQEELIIEETSVKSEETTEEMESVKEEVVEDEKEWEEYTVKDGDTLVAICKMRYGSTSKMKEICEKNNIKNADYIAPGQKIYLP